MALPNYGEMERGSPYNAGGGKSDRQQTAARPGIANPLPAKPVGVQGPAIQGGRIMVPSSAGPRKTVDLTKPAPLPGWLGRATEGVSNFAQNAMSSAAKGVMGGGLNVKNWGNNAAPVAAPSAAPVANVPTVAPQAPAPTSAQVRTPGADELNASYDKAGYGPHSTEAQASQARVGVQPNPIQPPSVAPASSPRDNLREGMMRQFQDAAWHAEHNGNQLVDHGDGSYHWDSGNHDNYVRQMQGFAGSIGQLDQNDPNKQIGLLRQIAADPVVKGMYLASKGVDGQTIASLPGPQIPGQYNATNFDSPESQQNPQTGRAAAILADESPIHEKAALFASIPGIENPNSPHRQLWDAYMARQHSQGPAFHNELSQYNPGSPGGEIHHNNPFSQFWADATGGDRALQDRNARFHSDMGRLGYGPTSIAANNAQAKIGVQPVDY